MKLLSFSVLVLLLSQKPVLEKYEGGHLHKSQLVLTLFRDSTFTYTTWYHSSPKEVSTVKGVWRKQPGRLILTSNKRKNGLFQNDSFELAGDTLFLFYRYDKEELIQLIRKRR
jgi:hypothetical protein